MRSRKTENIQPLLIGGFLMSAFLGYILYKSYKSEQNLLSIMTIPLILGIVFENKRLSSDWRTIFLKILGAFFGSLFIFLPWKNEQNYNFENHIIKWPYAFIIIFVIISVIYHKKKIIPKLTEGITLLQSISIIYWIIDIGFLNYNKILVYITMAIVLAFCSVSFIYAFSNIKLTQKSRLFLSVWSSIIMIIFAVDHIYRVFYFNHFSENKIFNNSLNVLQYFLLGVSLIYIFQNASMLIRYLPDRNKSSFYGKEKMKEIRKVNKMHIKRYSQNKVTIWNSVIVLFFTSAIFYWNYKHPIMPRHTLIWLVFWLSPFVIWLKEKLFENYSNMVK